MIRNNSLFIAILAILLLSLFGSGCSNRPVVPAGDCAGRCVVLLHGLGRTASSMQKMENALFEAGYCTVNAGYPSREEPVETIVNEQLPEMVATCRNNGAETIHFVTHSLGGILVRAYLQEHKLPEGSRIVMISPPNHGSQIVDTFKGLFLFRWIYGPAGQVLGTGGDSLPSVLAPVDAEIGIITGSRSYNPVLSAILPGADDGKVTVESAKLEEMQDFLVVPRTHTFIMKDEEVIRQVIAFLDTGQFDAASE